MDFLFPFHLAHRWRPCRLYLSLEVGESVMRRIFSSRKKPDDVLDGVLRNLSELGSFPCLLIVAGALWNVILPPRTTMDVSQEQNDKLINLLDHCRFGWGGGTIITERPSNKGKVILDFAVESITCWYSSSSYYRPNVQSSPFRWLERKKKLHR